VVLAKKSIQTRKSIISPFFHRKIKISRNKRSLK